jgi:hypothetical protein
MNRYWSRTEVELIVADYLTMLTAELKGEEFNKSDHRRRISKHLDGRSDGSIERKHQNISAILIENGFPYVSGYKPLGNYQQLLADVVLERLTEQSMIRVVASSTEKPAKVPHLENVLDIEEGAPKPVIQKYPVREPVTGYTAHHGGGQINYLERESRNISLGSAGEELVLRFEIARLRRAGRDQLADRIEQVSQTEGPSAGFDIRSFEVDGRDRYIEVKTTSYPKETPFFVTRCELRTSEIHEKQYHLYRVFGFHAGPHLFRLAGRLDRVCRLDPVQYVGHV